MTTPEAGSTDALDRTSNTWADHAWLLAALARHLHHRAQGDGLTSEIDEAVAGALSAAGVPVDEIAPEEAAIRARALRSVLAQLVALSDASALPSWGELDDGTLLAQGRASGGLARMFVSPEGPFPREMVERLAAPGAVFLDVGVGIGAICATLCGAMPELRCVGLDVLPRALDLADKELTARGVRDRVELRLQDVQDLDDSDAYDVAWIPLPLLPEDVARVAVQRVTAALRPGGWVLVAAGRPQQDPLQRAIGRLRAATVGGCAADEADVRGWLEAAGLADVTAIRTPPAAPHLLTCRLPA